MLCNSTCLSKALCIMNYTAQKSKFNLNSIKISSVGTWPATYILHHVGNILTAFSGDPVKQLSFTSCPESHQIWAIPDWEGSDSRAWEPLEDPLPAALSPLMRRSQLVGPYWLQMWHFGRRRGWTCRQTSARLLVTALLPPSPELWCFQWGVLLSRHQGLFPPSTPGPRWCKAELHLVLNQPAHGAAKTQTKAQCPLNGRDHNLFHRRRWLEADWVTASTSLSDWRLAPPKVWGTLC